MEEGMEHYPDGTGPSIRHDEVDPRLWRNRKKGQSGQELVDALFEMVSDLRSVLEQHPGAYFSDMALVTQVHLPLPHQVDHMEPGKYEATRIDVRGTDPRAWAARALLGEGIAEIQRREEQNRIDSDAID